MATAYAPDFNPGGEHPPISMDTDPVSRYTGKRKSEETETPQETNQDAKMSNPDPVPDKQDHQNTLIHQTATEPEKKKRYAGNAVRRSKTLLRMDFPNATNRQEAYGQWTQVLLTIRNLDPTTTIHSLDKT